MAGTASKAEPALPIEHHHDLEAVSPPDLMAIDQAAADTGTDWTMPFIEFLAWGNLLDDLTEARHLAKTLQIIHDHR
jgi:hypothetical protein